MPLNVREIRSFSLGRFLVENFYFKKRNLCEQCCMIFYKVWHSPFCKYAANMFYRRSLKICYKISNVFFCFKRKKLLQIPEKV